MITQLMITEAKPGNLSYVMKAVFKVLIRWCVNSQRKVDGAILIGSESIQMMNQIATYNNSTNKKRLEEDCLGNQRIELDPSTKLHSFEQEALECQEIGKQESL